MAEPSQRAGAAVGDQIGGYRLVRLLGDGSTSAVFLGEHVRLGRKAAIKVLDADLVDDEQTIRRLLNEARVVNDIRHPNIIDISDFVEEADPRRVALVMEYVEGPNLKTFRGDPLAYPQALGLGLQLVDAVQAAHAHGVIHRDLKPDNLLLTFDPATAPSRGLELKVVDFGIAKVSGPTAQGMTVTGTVLGTPAYMAPEQIAGSPAPSAATDVFALGAVLYELVTGVRAYPSPRVQETVRAKLRGEMPALETPNVPGGDRLVHVVRRCLARHPSERPDLSEVRDALQGLLPLSAAKSVTDAIEIPTMGLTAVGALPPAATELSEIPVGALRAARSAAALAPTLEQLSEFDEDEDDEVGTELARPSLDDLGALEHAETADARAEAPAVWGRSERDVATAAAVDGLPIPGVDSSPTNRLLEAPTIEPGPDEPRTSTGELYLGGLMSPAGMSEPELDLHGATKTFPGVDVPAPSAPAREPQDTLPPPAPSSPRAKAQAPAPPPDSGRAGQSTPPEGRATAEGLDSGAPMRNTPPEGRATAEALDNGAPGRSTPSELRVPAPARPATRGVSWWAGVIALLLVVIAVGVTLLIATQAPERAPEAASAPPPPPPPPAPTATPR